MSTSPFALLGKTRGIEHRIDEFLDILSEAGMVFEQGVCGYFDHGVDAKCEGRLDQISHLEARGDELRREIEATLYTEMLIPESRGDVLGLLDDLDWVIDVMKKCFLSISIEKPRLANDNIDDVKELVSSVAKGVDALMMASRTYFRDPGGVRNHIHKVSFHESECDRLSIHLKKCIFDGDDTLQQKMHQRDCVDMIDRIADELEDVSDRLSIYAIKRSL